jgi:Family of unknown function (DUF5519)
MTESMAAALCQIEGVLEGESAFKAGAAFWAGGKEIAHFEGEHAIDLRLTRAEIRARRAELRADPRICLRASASDWITVEFAGPDDEAFVLELASVAAAAHRPADGSAPPPPAPTGAALARRRRFH